MLAGIPTVYNILLLILGLHLGYNYFRENIGQSYEKARHFIFQFVLFIAIYYYRKTNAGFLKVLEVIKIDLVILNLTFPLINSLIFGLIMSKKNKETPEDNKAITS